MDHNRIRQVVSIRSQDFPLINSVFESRGTEEHWPRRHLSQATQHLRMYRDAISRDVEYNMNINRSENKMDDILSRK